MNVAKMLDGSVKTHTSTKAIILKAHSKRSSLLVEIEKLKEINERLNREITEKKESENRNEK